MMPDVTWSIATLLLALNVIAAICVLYITYRAFQQSVWWGLFFLLTPVAFFFLSGLAGPLIAGVLILGGQAYFVKKYWVLVGRIFVYMVICWIGSTAIAIRTSGFIPPGSALASLGSPAVEQAGTPTTNATEAYLPVDGGRIWYRLSGTGSGTPVILLHGGPGISSHYLKPLEALGEDRPVVRYDQLGAGRSTKVIDTSLFTIPRFVRELDSLRSALGYERVHIVGHSWGTVLAFEYYVAHRNRVASLTLASAALSIPAWQRNTRALLKTLSDSAQLAIQTREAVKDYDAPDYISAVNEFYAKYVWLRPVEADVDSTMKSMNQAMYAYMWGPSEFTITGTLRSYDASRRLRSIRVPTLYTVGEFDEAGPATVKRFATLTRGARVEVIPDAAHVMTWDNPDVSLQVIRDFLRGVDALALPTTAHAP